MVHSDFGSTDIMVELHGFEFNKLRRCDIIGKIKECRILQKIVRRYGCNFKSPLGDLGAVFKWIFRPKPLKGMLNSIVFEKLK